MPPPPLLILRNIGSSGNPQVSRLLAGTTGSQLGNDITVVPLEELPTARFTSDANRVVHYDNDLYAIIEDQIVKYNSGTNNWDTEFTLTITTTERRKADLWPIDINGTPSLIALFVNSSVQYAMVTFDGTTWTQTNLGTSANNDLHLSAVYRNKVFLNTDGGSQVIEVDPTTPTLVAHSIPGKTSVSAAGDFQIFQGRFFYLATDGVNAGDNWGLWEYTGATWVRRSFINTATDDAGASAGTFELGNAGENGACALFTDGTDLFGLMPGRTAISNEGSVLAQWTPNGNDFDETNLSATVLPADRQLGGGDGDGTKWNVWVDNDTTPTSPGIHIWFLSANDTGNYTYYEWNGTGSPLSTGAASVSHEFKLPSGSVGGGARVWTSGELNIKIEDVVPFAGGGLQIQFTAYNDVGPADKIVKFFFNPDEEVPTTQATLAGTPVVISGPAAAPTRNVNQLENVEADDGASVYGVQWDTATDGIATNDHFSLIGQITT